MFLTNFYDLSLKRVCILFFFYEIVSHVFIGTGGVGVIKERDCGLSLIIYLVTEL